MKVRKIAGLAVAVPALVVALAQPGNAASLGVVEFAGTLSITPRADGAQVTTNVCFFGLAKTCANGTESSGVAAGPALDTAALDADAIDGLQVSATYSEPCTTGSGLAPVGMATLSGNVHKSVTPGWSGDIKAEWIRAGLVAVVAGGANGVALFTPAGVPVCGQPVQVAVTGAVQVAY